MGLHLLCMGVGSASSQECALLEIWSSSYLIYYRYNWEDWMTSEKALLLYSVKTMEFDYNHNKSKKSNDRLDYCAILNPIWCQCAWIRVIFFLNGKAIFEAHLHYRVSYDYDIQRGWWIVIIWTRFNSTIILILLTKGFAVLNKQFWPTSVWGSPSYTTIYHSISF